MELTTNRFLGVYFDQQLRIQLGVESGHTDDTGLSTWLLILSSLLDFSFLWPNIWQEAIWKKKASFGLFMGHSVMGWWQELEAASHITFTVRKKGTINAHTWLAFSIWCSSGSSIGKGTAHCYQCAFPSQWTRIGKSSQAPTEARPIYIILHTWIEQLVH